MAVENSDVLIQKVYELDRDLQVALEISDTPPSPHVLALRMNALSNIALVEQLKLLIGTDLVHNGLKASELRYFPHANAVEVAGRRSVLTRVEDRLMGFLVEHVGRTVMLEQLEGSMLPKNGVGEYVRRLRKKIEENPKDPKNLISIAGRGYQLVDCQIIE